jgi:Flp pilus assembly pilin Flp
MTKFFASLHNRLFELRDREEGQTFAEYGLIIAVVAVLLIGALVLFRGDIEGVLTDIGNALNP